MKLGNSFKANHRIVGLESCEL